MEFTELIMNSIINLLNEADAAIHTISNTMLI